MGTAPVPENFVSVQVHRHTSRDYFETKAHDPSSCCKHGESILQKAREPDRPLQNGSGAPARVGEEFMQRNTTLLWAAALLPWINAAVTAQQVTFREFAQDYTIITDASADASVVVGLYDSPAKTHCVSLDCIGRRSVDRCSRACTATPASRGTGGPSSGLCPIPEDVLQPPIWQGGTTWKLLDSFPGVVPSEQNACTDAVAVSADGSVVVGGAYLSLTKVVTFRWDAQNGMVNLGTFDEGSNSDSRPYAVSGDGKVVIGWDYKEGFVLPGPSGAAMNGRRGAIWWDGKERTDPCVRMGRRGLGNELRRHDHRRPVSPNGPVQQPSYATRRFDI